MPKTIALLDNSMTFRSYLEPVFQALWPGNYVVHSTPGRASDLVFSSFEQQQRGEAARTPGKKVMLCGEPSNATLQDRTSNLIIDCKKLIQNNARYAYLPFAVLSFAERFQNKIADLLVPKHEAEILQKTKFCAYMYSRPNVYRENLFCAISGYKRVDSLGPNLNNMAPAAVPPPRQARAIIGRRRGVQIHPASAAPATDRGLYIPGVRTYNDSAVAKYRPYKFVIACENTSLLGYVTEKIVSPMLAHSIPIYFGAPDVATIFNPKSFINANSFASVAALVNHIREVDNNPALYKQMFLEPYFVNNTLPSVFASNHLCSVLGSLG